jgi:hypothetical protein
MKSDNSKKIELNINHLILASNETSRSINYYLEQRKIENIYALPITDLSLIYGNKSINYASYIYLNTALHFFKDLLLKRCEK